MSFRFHKSIRIIPGVSVNLSKTGLSLSVGPKGAKTNVSKRGVRTTTSIPRSGFSWSKLFKW